MLNHLATSCHRHWPQEKKLVRSDRCRNPMTGIFFLWSRPSDKKKNRMRFHISSLRFHASTLITCWYEWMLGRYFNFSVFTDGFLISEFLVRVSSLFTKNMIVNLTNVYFSWCSAEFSSLPYYIHYLAFSYSPSLSGFFQSTIISPPWNSQSTDLATC